MVDKQSESALDLMRRIPAAALRRVRSHVPDAVANTLLTVCGLIVLVTPLALWVAWTKEIFYYVLLGGIVAFFIAIAVISSAPDGEF